MFSNIINISDINSLDGQQYLSSKEQEIYKNRQSSERKQKFLAGRILAKYLLLQQITNDENKTRIPKLKPDLIQCKGKSQAENTILNFETVTKKEDGICPSEFTLNQITCQQIAIFPTCLYQKLEILPTKLLSPQTGLINQVQKQGNTNAYLSIFWCNEWFPMQISIAHHDNISMVSLSKKYYLGLDIESCEQRAKTFYENSFTTHEKDWVFQTMQAYNVRKNWLFTLLWTLKEAGLKLLSHYGIKLTLWNMPALEINILKENNLDVFRQMNQQGLHSFRCKIYLNIYAKAIPATACIAFNQNQIITKLSSI